MFPIEHFQLHSALKYILDLPSGIISLSSADEFRSECTSSDSGKVSDSGSGFIYEYEQDVPAIPIMVADNVFQLRLSLPDMDPNIVKYYVALIAILKEYPAPGATPAPHKTPRGSRLLVDCFNEC